MIGRFAARVADELSNSALAKQPLPSRLEEVLRESIPLPEPALGRANPTQAARSKS